MTTPLPGMPEPPVPKKRRVLPPDVRVVRIHGFKGLCEQCCKDIHEQGQAVAPYPRLGRWGVSVGPVRERLCDAHKDERLEQ